MSEKSFVEKLKDLNLSNDELQRFSDAFKNEEFRKLFIEYAEELNDPKNRQLYEDEIRAVEAQQGSDVTFVHPKPGHVLKTTLNGTQKCFINIATNEHVEKPSFTKADPSSNKQGTHWSLPHCLAGPHEDVDHQSRPCTVYDVIFSPDTYRMAETNAKFMSMVEESALDSVEQNYHCRLDKKNVKRLKMKFKGEPKATIIRKKQEQQQTEQETKQETDQIIDKAISTAQNHKVVLSSHNRPVNSSPSMNNAQPQTSSIRTDENGYTIPTHRIVHRGEFDMQDCANSFLPQVRSMRPKELLVEIDLPLCASSSNVDLDVCERSLKVHCDSPKYSLDLPLPYPVRESDSHARFDKKQRKLIVTLAVIKEEMNTIEMNNSDENMEQTTEDIEETSPTVNNQIVPTVETSTIKHFSDISFEYKEGQGHFALVLQVKNVDKSSFKMNNDGQHLTIQLTSLGSGHFPMNHQLVLDFPDPATFETSEQSTQITFNEENILILLKKSNTDQRLSQFSSGIHREEMKIHNLTQLNAAKETNSSTVAKEDFLREPSSSSSSSNSDQQKPLTKRQAKRLAKKNSASNVSEQTNNDQLTENMTQISLQTNVTNEDRDELKESEDNENEETTSTNEVHPSVYRRHMSESQVDLERTTSGEFKLKGILKNSAKYRSYSESFSEPSTSLTNDYPRDEAVFEACSTNDDLTSSNENNSIVASPDSASGGGSGNLCTTPSSSAPVKRVTFNNQVARKTFKPGGPVSGMKKMSSNQQRKLKKRRRQDSLNSQSSDQDDQTPQNNSKAKETKPSENYKNPVEFENIISQQAQGDGNNQDATTSKSAVRFTNPLIFELEN